MNANVNEAGAAACDQCSAGRSSTEGEANTMGSMVNKNMDCTACKLK